MADPRDADLDPVRVRRAKIARLARWGNRIGAGCYGAACVLFLLGLTTRYTPTMTNAIIGLLLIAVQIGLRGFDDVDARFWAYVWVGLPLLFVAYFRWPCPSCC